MTIFLVSLEINLELFSKFGVANSSMQTSILRKYELRSSDLSFEIQPSARE